MIVVNFNLFYQITFQHDFEALCIKRKAKLDAVKQSKEVKLSVARTQLRKRNTELLEVRKKTTLWEETSSITLSELAAEESVILIAIQELEDTISNLTKDGTFIN